MTEAIPQLKHWIDTTMQHTQGWPQHIIAYGETAAIMIQQSLGKLTDQGLKEVLK